MSASPGSGNLGLDPEEIYTCSHFQKWVLQFLMFTLTSFAFLLPPPTNLSQEAKKHILTLRANHVLAPQRLPKDINL